jgi:hypothetical protein
VVLATSVGRSATSNTNDQVGSMKDWKIILVQVAFSAWCQVSVGQFAPPGPPAVVYPDESCGQSSPMMVMPGPQMGPVYGEAVIMTPLPPGSTPLPGALPPQFGAPPGSAVSPPMMGPPVAGPPMLGPNGVPIAPNPQAMNLGPNPISIPAIDELVAWDQIVDVVSDYFTVAREQQVRRSGEVWTEGIIETAPQDGATWLEPHRKDSVGSFNRWESTFQTIRRRAHVRVMPDASGYLVEVIVEKELEDLPNPEKSTAGAATFRADNGPSSRRLEQVSRTRLSPLWIQLGRDPLLEQRILGDIQARLGGVAAGPPAVLVR